MPETSHQYTSHTSDTENLKAAHTDSMLFGSVSNCPASVKDDVPSGIAISKAQQETSVAVHEESCSSEIPLSGSACSIASFGNAFLPSFTPPSGLYRHKVSDVSIPDSHWKVLRPLVACWKYHQYPLASTHRQEGCGAFLLIPQAVSVKKICYYIHQILILWTQMSWP